MNALLLVSVAGLTLVGGVHSSHDEADARREFGPYMDEWQLSGIVPEYLKKAPERGLTVAYDTIRVRYGHDLTPTQTLVKPKFMWWKQSIRSRFWTVMMLDLDAPSRADPSARPVLHWLVGNVVGNKLNTGQTVAEYFGPGPEQGSGFHRYLFLVFLQEEFGPMTFDPIPFQSRFQNFDVEGFMAKYKLELWAGNFFQAEWDESVPLVMTQIQQMGLAATG